MCRTPRRRVFLTLVCAVLFCTSVSSQQPTPAEIITQIQGLLETLKTAVAPAPAATVVKVGANLQAAIDAAPDGAVLALEPGTYDGAIRLTKPITLQPTVTVAAGRATRTSAAVLVRSAGLTVAITGPDITLRGLEVRSTDPSQTTVSVRTPAAHVLLDRLVVLGDPLKGQHRCIEANGATTTIRGTFVDDCFLPARDAQAVSGWDGTDGLLIEDSYLGGGAQSVMFGGADAASVERLPKHIIIRGSTLSKNPAWYGLGAQIKTALELKAAIDVTVTDCVLEYAGTSQGQGAYLFVLTPRNQDGKAPFTTVDGVVIERVTGRHAGGIMNLLGYDTTVGKPSGPLKTVTVRDSTFEDIDPQNLTKMSAASGSGRLFFFDRGPANVTLENLTVQGQNIAALIYVETQPPPGLIVRNWKVPTARYGWKTPLGTTLAKFKEYAPDAVLAVTATDVGAPAR